MMDFEDDGSYLATLGLYEISRIAEKIGLSVADVLREPKGIIEQVQGESDEV